MKAFATYNLTRLANLSKPHTPIITNRSVSSTNSTPGCDVTGHQSRDEATRMAGRLAIHPRVSGV